MKKNQKGFVPIIIIIVVLIGFVGVYYLGRLNPKKEVSNPSPSSVATVIDTSKPTIPTIKPTTDPTANWKTYTNTKYGYSIGYLSTYVISNNVDGSDGTIPANADNISLSESKNTKYEDRLIDISYQGYLIDISPFDQWQKTSVTIAGIKAFKYTKMDGSVNFDYYHIPSKGTEGIEIMANNKQKAKVDQILSTFKFTN